MAGPEETQDNCEERKDFADQPADETVKNGHANEDEKNDVQAVHTLPRLKSYTPASGIIQGEKVRLNFILPEGEPFVILNNGASGSGKDHRERQEEPPHPGIMEFRNSAING